MVPIFRDRVVGVTRGRSGRRKNYVDGWGCCLSSKQLHLNVYNRMYPCGTWYNSTVVRACDTWYVSYLDNNSSSNAFCCLDDTNCRCSRLLCRALSVRAFGGNKFTQRATFPFVRNSHTRQHQRLWQKEDHGKWGYVWIALPLYREKLQKSLHIISNSST